MELQPLTPRRNIEIKAHCKDLSEARRKAEEIGAKFDGILNQIDTYFHVPQGRLKLRRINGDNTELIWYQRENQATARASEYHVAPVTDADLMLAVLGGALGVRGQVRKRRELLLWHNVRIHLDEVEKLGTFIEFEAVISDGNDEATSRARIKRLSRELEIDEPIAVSYPDLLGFS
jgi:adenylate cyclase class 2